MSTDHTTHAQRIEIIERYQAGVSLSRIAVDMRLNYYSVRRWWRKYRDEGWAGIRPQRVGRKAVGALGTFAPLVKYVALKLKRQHPGWGLDKLRLEMERHASLRGMSLPCRSSLHHYLKQFYPRLTQHRPLRNEVPPMPRERARQVHECWQMDFKGEVRFEGIGQVKPFMVCDEYSSAPLAGILHEVSQSALKMRDVQHSLRQVFTLWGLPDQLRMDRDPLFVGTWRAQFPSTLMLWLVGLGITPIVNRARQPRDNAHIERCNGIWVDQVARGACPTSLTHLQILTDKAWLDRLTALPSRNPACDGQPPLTALPALASPRRPYHPCSEADLFQMSRVFTYLAGWSWRRIVDASGQFSLANFRFRVSSSLRAQVLQIRFDPTVQRFHAATLLNSFVTEFDLPSLEPSFILGGHH